MRVKASPGSFSLYNKDPSERPTLDSFSIYLYLDTLLSCNIIQIWSMPYKNKICYKRCFFYCIETVYTATGSSEQSWTKSSPVLPHPPFRNCVLLPSKKWRYVAGMSAIVMAESTTKRRLHHLCMLLLIF